MISLKALYKKQRGRCYFCERKCRKVGSSKKRPMSPTREHLTPRSRGGCDSHKNVVMSCETCNTKKGDMTEQEFADAMAIANENKLAAMDEFILEAAETEDEQPTT